MNCILCATRPPEYPIQEALFTIEGASLCGNCAHQVINSYIDKPYSQTAQIWWDTNDRFHLLATIRARRATIAPERKR
jgi:hypothetical protein